MYDPEHDYSSYEETIPIWEMEETTAIIKIMEKYGNDIKRVIYTYVENTADTDDITQEVFVTIYKKLSTFKGKSSLKSWIYKIAINKCKDYQRSWKYRNKRLIKKLTNAAYTDNKGIETPQDYAIKQDMSGQLYHSVMSLPTKYREVIVLYYFQDFSTREISHFLNVKESTIRTRLRRGKEELKNLFKE